MVLWRPIQTVHQFIEFVVDNAPPNVTDVTAASAWLLAGSSSSSSSSGAAAAAVATRRSSAAVMSNYLVDASTSSSSSLWTTTTTYPFNDTLFEADGGGGGGGYDGYHVFTPVEIVFWFVMYGLIAFLAVTGNLLVIFVVLTQKKLQNVPNYFIVNLAIADAITGLIAVPFKFQAALLQRWTLPAFMCQLLTFTETLSLSVSVFTLTASAADRFIVVLTPSKWKMTPAVAICTLASIWIFSVACSLPFGMGHLTIGFVNDSIVAPNETMLFEPSSIVWRCMPIHGDQRWWRWYNVYLTIIQYFVPLIVVDGAYILIAYRVWVTEPISAFGADRRFQKDRRKVVKLLVIVVTLFTFCWLPYETYLLLSEVTPNINMFFFINVIFMLSHCLAMSNSCINPIIYGIYNKKFQREYRRVFYNCCGLSGAAGGGGALRMVPGTEMHQLGGNGRGGGTSDDDGRQSPDGDTDNHHPNSTHHFITSELGR